MSENTLEIYQEEDVTKIINKSLEVKDGKLTEKGWSDISKTLQAYSDKRFETARYLFVQNGKIIRHVAISVQNPNATISKPDENVTYLEKLKTFAQMLKARNIPYQIDYLNCVHLNNHFFHVFYSSNQMQQP